MQYIVYTCHVDHVLSVLSEVCDKLRDFFTHCIVLHKVLANEMGTLFWKCPLGGQRLEIEPSHQLRLDPAPRMSRAELVRCEILLPPEGRRAASRANCKSRRALLQHAQDQAKRLASGLECGHHRQGAFSKFLHARLPSVGRNCLPACIESAAEHSRICARNAAGIMTLGVSNLGSKRQATRR